MKKLARIFLFASLVGIILSVPYFVGALKYMDCLVYITNSGAASDGDIQDALYIFGFNNDVLSDPTFAQYYKVGLNTIF